MLTPPFPVEEEPAINPLSSPSDRTLLEQTAMFWAHNVGIIDNRMRERAAKALETHKQIRLLHEIIQLTNQFSEEKGPFDLKKSDPEIEKKFAMAEQFGVKIPRQGDSYQTVYPTRDALNRLVGNIQMVVADLDVEIKRENHAIQILMQESQRLITLANQAMKTEKEMNNSAIRGIGGR